MIKVGLSKGRIEDVFYQNLIDKKIIKEYDRNSRKLEKDVDEYELYSLKSSDIVNLILNGYLDVGVIGSDVVGESNSIGIIELCDLQTGNCSFVLASKPDTDINDIKRIATKYPTIARELLKSINLDCEIKIMNGSLELAPRLGYADAIIDLVETGTTLRENGLQEIIRFYNISTRIITREENKENQSIKKFIKRIGE